MENRFHKPAKGDDLRLDADLLHELPGERGGHCLADLDGAPPGRLKRPSSGASARRTMSTLPFRNTAAETARMGRAGNNRSFMGHLPPSRGRRSQAEIALTRSPQ